jgi:hypothetical protein
MLDKEQKFKREIVSAIIDLSNAVEQIELVCEGLIDCNDARLMEARSMLGAVNSAIESLTQQ